MIKNQNKAKKKAQDKTYALKFSFHFIEEEFL